MKTGEEAVNKILNLHPILGVGFILDSVLNYSKYILDNEEAVREQMKSNFIEPDAWLRIAKDSKDIVENFNNQDVKG